MEYPLQNRHAVLWRFKLWQSTHFSSSVTIWFINSFLLLKESKETKVLLHSPRWITVIWCDTHWSNLVMKWRSCIVIRLLFYVPRMFPQFLQLFDVEKLKWLCPDPHQKPFMDDQNWYVFVQVMSPSRNCLNQLVGVIVRCNTYCPIQLTKDATNHDCCNVLIIRIP